MDYRLWQAQSMIWREIMDGAPIYSFLRIINWTSVIHNPWGKYGSIIPQKIIDRGGEHDP